MQASSLDRATDQLEASADLARILRRIAPRPQLTEIQRKARAEGNLAKLREIRNACR